MSGDQSQFVTSQTNNSEQFPVEVDAASRHARTWMTAWLLLADTCGLLLAGLAGFVLRYVIADLFNPPFYWNLLALIPIFLILYALRGLYPAVGLSPVEELRRLSTTTSAVFLVFTAFTFWVRLAEYFSRLIIAFSWAFALITVPLCRWIFRTIATNSGFWGEPVVVIGDGQQTQRVVNFLLDRMRFGLRPILVLIGQEKQTSDSSVPQISLNSYTSPSDSLPGLQTALLIDSELPIGIRDILLNGGRLHFRRLILISDLRWIGSLGVTPYDMEGLLGLEVRQNLLDPWHQRVKRTLDLLLSIILGILTLPITGLIALAIRLDTRGKIFYIHQRIGKDGEEINVLKFRSMIPEADQVLEDYLSTHPEAKAEWEKNHKLKNDPRVTSVGRLLRKTSLDELPQLWNVLLGELSLVGPRPIVEDEIVYYQKGFALYKQVRPGITGLWQTSGRTDTSYEERLRFDEYYVRNWSIWLDLYILLRTIWVVLRGEGAY
ncbi:undecaprenyl-phosphate galactose phosphotransferase WbaP [Chloroflexota bacterium]